MLQIPGLFLLNSEKKGRCVHTAHAIEEESLIEICHVIFLNPGDESLLDKTKLYEYYFHWPLDNKYCIALGLGSLYNHSSRPNAYVQFDLEQETIEIRSKCEISAGEEILLDYSGGQADAPKIWFDVVE